MTLAVSERSKKKRFAIGTLGWTADDLDDPRIERLWEKGRYEIVEGVLTEMPPAQLDSSPPLFELLVILKQFDEDRKLGGTFGFEVDVIISKRRVAIVDATYLTKPQMQRQAKLYSQKPNRKPRVRFGRVMIAPTLIIESISSGHEAHDRETKFRWYAEAGVSNYWILDPLRRTLECFVLVEAIYQLDVKGKGSDVIRPALFTGLVIDLAKIWR
jgi:Uma2 family endonuclease